MHCKLGLNNDFGLVFSRAYISKSRAVVVVVVVCPSVRHVRIVAKRCKIGLRLLLITNMKSHTGFQMTYKSLTLNDVEKW